MGLPPLRLAQRRVAELSDLMIAAGGGDSRKVFTSLVVGTGEGGGGGGWEDTEAIESDNGGIVLTHRWVVGLAMIYGVGGCG